MFGAAQPAKEWLDALRPGGRLIFPLAPVGVLGGMLLIKRPDQGAVWPAQFRGRAQFIGCIGLQDEDAGRRLTEAFLQGWDRVRSLRLHGNTSESSMSIAFWMIQESPTASSVMPYQLMSSSSRV